MPAMLNFKEGQAMTALKMDLIHLNGLFMFRWSVKIFGKALAATVTTRWQSSYEWQSFLVSGTVPSYHTVDAQLMNSYKSAWFKLGGSNIVNRPYRSFLGGPSVGGFYYLSITYGLGRG